MTDDVNALRPRMMSVAYRMLGSVVDAQPTCCGFRALPGYTPFDLRILNSTSEFRDGPRGPVGRGQGPARRCRPTRPDQGRDQRPRLRHPQAGTPPIRSAGTGAPP